MNALERARAELAGGDTGMAAMFALISIAESLEALATPPAPDVVDVESLCGCNQRCDRTCFSIDYGCPIHHPEDARP